MKRSCLVAVAAAGLMATAAWAETNVGVSIGISQPGVYGRIDIGTVPQPALIYAQPVVVVQPRVAVVPVYLYVPPGHQKNWAKHCARYDACGRPVYFVKEEWVRERYEEQQRHAQGNQGNQGNQGGKKNKNH